MAGRLAPGAKLPNENEIGERFGVSRATVREAVLGLMEAGYLARRHGSGTFVTKAPRSRHALDTTVSYTEMIREAGHEPSVTLLGKTLRDPDAYEIDSFGLDAGEQVIELERVRFADRRPVIYSRDRIAAAFAGWLKARSLGLGHGRLLLGAARWALERERARDELTAAERQPARAPDLASGGGHGGDDLRPGGCVHVRPVVHVLDDEAVETRGRVNARFGGRRRGQVRDAGAAFRCSGQRAEVDHPDERALHAEDGRDGSLRVHGKGPFYPVSTALF